MIPEEGEPRVTASPDASAMSQKGHLDVQKSVLGHEPVLWLEWFHAIGDGPRHAIDHREAQDVRSETGTITSSTPELL